MTAWLHEKTFDLVENRWTTLDANGQRWEVCEVFPTDRKSMNLTRFILSGPEAGNWITYNLPVTNSVDAFRIAEMQMAKSANWLTEILDFLSSHQHKEQP